MPLKLYHFPCHVPVLIRLRVTYSRNASNASSAFLTIFTQIGSAAGKTSLYPVLALAFTLLQSIIWIRSADAAERT